MAIIEGGPGHDSLTGTAGNDEIFGFAGNDRLDGGDGNDRLYGGADADLIRTGAGRDRAWGGSGNDTLRGAYGDQTLNGGAGDDQVLLAADDASWYLSVPGSNSHVGYGGDGNDLLQTWGNYDATLFGGDGVDVARMLYYSALPETMTVSLSGPDAGMTRSNGQIVSFDSIERLEFFADYGDHTVTGGDLDDVIHVGVGADSVLAGGGDDQVEMRLRGAHTLDGGAGDDLLLVLGLWRQSIYFIVRPDGSVDDGNLSQISGFERFQVAAERSADDVISLGSGDDLASSAGGADTLFGMGGNDVLKAGEGADSVSGGDGNDTLIGGAGPDDLQGDAGNDRLMLDGADSAAGGSGADSFMLRAAGDAVITDFTTGEDRLVLRATDLFGFAEAVGRQDPGMLVFGSAERAGGQFVLTYDAGADRTVLWWDRDGNTGALPMDRLVAFDGGTLSLAHSDIVVV
jgi:Ca2+-binding RTX toxin-like protein